MSRTKESGKPKAKTTESRAARVATEAPPPELFRKYPTAIALVFLAVSLFAFFAPMVFSGKVFHISSAACRASAA